MTNFLQALSALTVFSILVAAAERRVRNARRDEDPSGDLRTERLHDGLISSEAEQHHV